jgi:hypothetical protein
LVNALFDQSKPRIDETCDLTVLVLNFVPGWDIRMRGFQAGTAAGSEHQYMQHLREKDDTAHSMENRLKSGQ